MADARRHLSAINPKQRAMNCPNSDASAATKLHSCNHKSLNPSDSPEKSKMFSLNQDLKPAISPSLCTSPAIGFATTPKEKMSDKESLDPRKQLMSTISSGPFSPTISDHDIQNNFMAVERDLERFRLKPGVFPFIHEEAPTEDTAFENCDSLMRKRQRTDSSAENDGCKRCRCRKSKCLKLYCECFAAGVYCSEPCWCDGCFNDPINERTVLAAREQIKYRNPHAFTPKVVRASDAVSEMGQDHVIGTSPLACRKRGCKCIKSNCRKKYCECYQSGVGCSIRCGCQGCKNEFGKKKDILPLQLEEIERGDEENHGCKEETIAIDDNKYNASTQIKHRHSLQDTMLIPSLQNCRVPIQLSSISSARPQSSKLLLCSSEIFHRKLEFEKNSRTIDDGSSANLSAIALPSNDVESTPPNSDRVSPIGFSLMGSQKGFRKLLLKSIPSNPALANAAFP